MAAVSLPRCSTAPIRPPFHCLGAQMHPPFHWLGAPIWVSFYCFGAPIFTYELTMARDKFY